MNVKKYLLLNLALISFTAFTQTGPGGVLDQANNRLWISVDDANTINGNLINNIPDQSGNGHDMSIGTISQMPTFSSNVLNTHSVANFDGVQRLFNFNGDPAIEASDITIISVMRLTTDVRQMGTNLLYSGSKWIGSYSSSNIGYMNKLASIHRISAFKGTPPTSAVFSNFTIFTQTYDNGGMEVFLNSGLDIVTNTSLQTPTGHSSYGIGQISSTSYYGLKGDLAETMVFNTKLTPSQRIIIENYLSSKYDVDISASGNDYYTQEGSGHFHEVFGIGQLSGQANSVAQGTGVLEVSNASNLDDNEFLMMGHDNANFNLFSGDVPSSLPEAERWNRTWRVSETGEVGTLTLVFDMTDIGFGSPVTSYRLLIDPNQDGNFSDVVSPVTGTFDVQNQTLTFTNVDLSDGDYFTVAADRAIISVNGGGDWTDPLTWNCSCVPTHLDSAIIDDGDIVTVDMDTAINGLLVNPTGTLDLSSQNLDIRENLAINGGLNSSTGSITFNGAVNSTIDLGGQVLTFNDLIMDVGSGQTLTANNGSLEFDGTFFPTSGDLADGSANFIINSTSATETGEVGPIGTNANILEPSFTIRRFAPSGVAENREISSPLNGMTVTELDDDFEISGTGMPDGCSYEGDGSCYATLKYFDSPSTSYVDVHNVSHVMQVGRGYEMWFGDDLQTWSGTTYDMNGTLNGASDITVNFGSGYDLEFIGNPYASAIDFNQLQRTDVYDHFYVYDAAIDAYQWYCASCGAGGTPDQSTSDLAGGIIALGQGFWVEDINSGSLTFTQNAKVSDGETFIRNQAITQKIIVAEANTHRKASLTLGINNAASLEKDQMDLRNMPRLPGRKNIRFSSLTSFGDALRVNYINSLENKVSIPLQFEATEDGEYILTAEHFEEMVPYQCAKIHDAVADELFILDEETLYTFEYIADGSQNERFTVLLNKEDCKSIEGSMANISDLTVENDVNMIQRDRILEFNFAFDQLNTFNVQITNTLGQEVMSPLQWEISKGSRTIQIPEHVSGILVVRLNNGENQLVEKVFVK